MTQDALYFAQKHSQEAVDLVKALIADGQEHLFQMWGPPGTLVQRKTQFINTLLQANRTYPGGLRQYIANARKLLDSARRGDNPFEGFVPEEPDVTDLTELNDTYERMEALGVQAFEKTAVVLVAGGLGERLGYEGIKLKLPVESIEGTSYLAHYAACLLGMEARMDRPHPVPLVIMTSQDTHEATVAALEANKYYGLAREQVHLLQQDLVPAIADNEGRLAVSEPFHLEMKPHGHGDVHLLLHTSGLAAALMAEGIEFFAFIQDTNGQVFNAMPAALGVMVDQKYDFNSLAVRRVPGEAVGGLARLVKGDHAVTLNVEYNQLDPLLRATVNPEGDVAGPDGYSPFPGNINVLITRAEPYVRVLQESGGIIAEFVNPKYSDEKRSRFKKPTRLETLMQDLPKLFVKGERVGVTVFPRSWCFSPNKNNVTDAAAKHAAQSPPECAATAESDFYAAGRTRLALAEIEVTAEPEQEILGVPYTDGPRVLLRPSFAMTFAEGRAKLTDCSISGPSTLLLDGPGIQLEDVHLRNGAALVIHACPGAEVQVSGTLDGGPGIAFRRLSAEELAQADTPAELRMRGYRYVDEGVTVYRYDTPGVYQLQLG